MSRLSHYRITTPEGRTTTLLPSRAVQSLKEQARKLKRQQNIPHHAALDLVAQQFGLPHWRAVCDAHEAMRPHEQALQSGWLVAFDIKDGLEFAADEAGFAESHLAPLMVREMLFEHFANTPDLEDEQQRPLRITLGPHLDEVFEDELSNLLFFLYSGPKLPDTIEAAKQQLRVHSFWSAQYMWLRGQLHDPFLSAPSAPPPPENPAVWVQDEAGRPILVRNPVYDDDGRVIIVRFSD